MISYTNTDDFYLIHLSFQNPDKYSFDIIKLINLDNPSSSFFSFLWFKQPTKPHFSSIKIELISN